MQLPVHVMLTARQLMRQNVAKGALIVSPGTVGVVFPEPITGEMTRAQARQLAQDLIEALEVTRVQEANLGELTIDG